MSQFLPIRQRIDDYYVFRNPFLLTQALTHKSWLNEQIGADMTMDNQRLEFLGDAALKAIQGRYLFEKYPAWDEGRLTKTRGRLENNRTLSVWCCHLGLDTAIKAGMGVPRVPSKAWDGICAQVFEAFLGAIWQDSGYDLALIYNLYVAWDLPIVEIEIENAKGRLQEIVQKHTRTGGTGGNPSYIPLAQEGPDHRPSFRVQCSVPFLQDAVVGEGASKKEAQVNAANKMLRVLADVLNIEDM